MISGHDFEGLGLPEDPTVDEAMNAFDERLQQIRNRNGFGRSTPDKPESSGFSFKGMGIFLAILAVIGFCMPVIMLIIYFVIGLLSLL